jgi:hypothetical protein
MRRRRKSRPFFALCVKLWASEIEQVQAVQSWPIFDPANWKDRNEPKEITGVNLIPDTFRNYHFCLRLADGRVADADRFYYEIGLGECWARWAIKRAIDWDEVN